MNQRQKNKFHKAIESLSDLIDELNNNQIGDFYILVYSVGENRFHIRKQDKNYNTDVEEQDMTYFSEFYVEE
jgi:hypothetical protein